MKDVVKIEDEETPENSVENPGRVDAFQFMMNNRSRIIGRNSPGKDKIEISAERLYSDLDLKTRKNFLENWAELKGASKRKRENDEKGIVIHKKLEKRAKRLKKLLKCNLIEEDDEPLILKKKCAVINSDSEDQDEPKENEAGNVNAIKMVLRTRKLKSEDEDSSLGSDSNEGKLLKNKRSEKKKLKMAPVFLKSVPKPKLDPEAVEAKRQFLLSGVPSSVKKEMEKQQSYEEGDFEVFPTISHVQQKTPESIFWNLTKANLQKLLDNKEPLNIEENCFSLNSLQEETFTEPMKYESVVSNRLKNHKQIIKDIKSKNPKYPVYKIFKSLYDKSGYVNPTEEDTREIVVAKIPKRRGRKKKNSVDNQAKGESVIKSEDLDNMMWTEKYKPNASSEIIGNHGCITSLKEWLSNWFKHEENSKQKFSDSESEFDQTDGDDNINSSGNTIILTGSVGSGKTAAVYAVCRELGFDVLEVNASSKRTGRRLLQQLQEATQSHQVRKEESLLTYFNQAKEKHSKPGMCVLLVEDVDIVFDQDEGFNTALTQIMNTSKRPLILTTSNENVINLQKLCRQTISFSPLSSILAVWLQVLCLVEGCYVDVRSIAELLHYNNGDIRKTLLQLQFWVTSGGGLKKVDCMNEVYEFTAACDEVSKDDSNLSDCRMNETSEIIQNYGYHHVCISSFESISKYRLFSLPCDGNLELVWWNLPSICNLHDLSNLRLNHCTSTQNGLEIKNTLKERQKLCRIFDVYDSLAFGDTIRIVNDCEEHLGKRMYTDSLRLEEDMSYYKDNTLSNELILALLKGTIQIYKENCGGTCSSLNMAAPSTLEEKWRLKQFSNAKKLKEALLVTDTLQRNALELDYMSSLRAIARFELKRSMNNTKRGGRFYNYLKNLGVSGGESVYKSVCNVFKSENEQ